MKNIVQTSLDLIQLPYINDFSNLNEIQVNINQFQNNPLYLFSNQINQQIQLLVSNLQQILYSIPAEEHVLVQEFYFNTNFSIELDKKFNNQPFTVPEFDFFQIGKLNKDLNFVKDMKLIIGKILTFIFKSSQEIHNFYDKQSQKEQNLSNISHVSLAYIQGQIVVLVGKNQISEDLFTFCEQFRIWNFLRYDMNINAVPQIQQHSVAKTFFNYFTQIRNLIYPNEVNSQEIEIKDQMEKNSEKLSKIRNFNEKGVYNNQYELLLKGFDQCSIRFKQLSGKESDFSTRKKQFTEILKGQNELWLNGQQIQSHSFNLIQFNKYLIICFQWKGKIQISGQLLQEEKIIQLQQHVIKQLYLLCSGIAQQKNTVNENNNQVSINLEQTANILKQNYNMQNNIDGKNTYFQGIQKFNKGISDAMKWLDPNKYKFNNLQELIGGIQYNILMRDNQQNQTGYNIFKPSETSILVQDPSDFHNFSPINTSQIINNHLNIPTTQNFQQTVLRQPLSSRSPSPQKQDFQFQQMQNFSEKDSFHSNQSIFTKQQNNNNQILSSIKLNTDRSKQSENKLNFQGTQLPTDSKKFLLNQNSFLSETSMMILKNRNKHQIEDKMVNLKIFSEILRKMNIDFSTNIQIYFKSIQNLKQVLKETLKLQQMVQMTYLPEIYKIFRQQLQRIIHFEEQYIPSQTYLISKDFEYFTINMIKYLLQNLDRLYDVLHYEQNQSFRELILDLFIFYIMNQYTYPKQMSLKFVQTAVTKEISELYHKFLMNSRFNGNVFKESLINSILKKYFALDIFDDWFLQIFNKLHVSMKEKQESLKDEQLIIHVFQQILDPDIIETMPKQMVYIFISILEVLYKNNDAVREEMGGGSQANKSEIEQHQWTFLLFLYLNNIICPRIEFQLFNNYTSFHIFYDKESMLQNNYHIKKLIHFVMENLQVANILVFDLSKQFFNRLEEKYLKTKMQSVSLNEIPVLTKSDFQKNKIQSQNHDQNSEFPSFDDISLYLCDKFLIDPQLLYVLFCSYKNFLQNNYIDKHGFESMLNNYLMKQSQINTYLQDIQNKQDYIILNLEENQGGQAYKLLYQNSQHNHEQNNKIEFTNDEIKQFMQIDDGKMKKSSKQQIQNSNQSSFFKLMSQINPNCKINDIEVQEIVRDEKFLPKQLSINNNSLKQQTQLQNDKNSVYQNILKEYTEQEVSDMIDDLNNCLKLGNKIKNDKEISEHETDIFSQLVKKIQKQQDRMIQYSFVIQFIYNDQKTLQNNSEMLQQKLQTEEQIYHSHSQNNIN